MSERFLKTLNEALEAELGMGTWTGDNNEPKKVDLEGKKLKSADGAHRHLNDPVDYTKLEIPNEFDARNHEQSEQARPALKPDLNPPAPR